MGVADNGRTWIRVHVNGPLKVNACALEFSCSLKFIRLLREVIG